MVRAVVQGTCSCKISSGFMQRFMSYRGQREKKNSDESYMYIQSVAATRTVNTIKQPYIDGGRRLDPFTVLYHSLTEGNTNLQRTCILLRELAEKNAMQQNKLRSCSFVGLYFILRHV